MIWLYVRSRRTLGRMNTSGTFAYLAWPLVVVGGFGLMVVLLRWTFSTGHSVVQRRPRTGTPTEYGLLVPVATPERA